MGLFGSRRYAHGRKEVNVDSNEGIWMKVPEAAEYFAVARSRMYDLIQSGELPAVWISERSIRVNRHEVEQFLTEHRRVHKGSA
jgi:excisionase family DNA binding protein